MYLTIYDRIALADAMLASNPSDPDVAVILCGVIRDIMRAVTA